MIALEVTRRGNVPNEIVNGNRIPEGRKAMTRGVDSRSERKEANEAFARCPSSFLLVAKEPTCSRLLSEMMII
jgi:hypothetical protein